MDSLLLLARLALAAVFVVAGLAKLADQPGSREAMLGFGVPAVLARPLGLLLPLVELAAAVALLSAAAAWWGGIAALALLLLFVTGIAVNLARGQAPDCHCFGQLHSEPVGWSTLGRNGLLALVAGFVVWRAHAGGGPSIVGWLGNQSVVVDLGIAAGVVILALVAAEGWLLLNLLRQNGRLLARVEALEAGVGLSGTPTAPMSAQAPELGLPVGTPAPAFQLPGLHGEILTLEALRAGGAPTLLVFADPGCGPCNALLPEIGRWQREEATKLTVAVISRGAQEANRAKASEHGLTRVLLQTEREVATAYQAYGTPSAVVVRADGTIGSPLAQGADQIRSLVARATGRIPLLPAPANGSNGNGAVQAPQAMPAPPNSLLGKPAPEVRLPDLGGSMVDLADFRGQETLVLFWNPGCGFCQRMLSDLKRWEADAPPTAPRLLLVSTGTAEANRAHGLRSSIVLDTGFTVGRQFGASGTPAAVLVDKEGRVASNVAVGAPAVLALAGADAADASAR